LFLIVALIVVVAFAILAGVGCWIDASIERQESAINRR